MPGAAAAVGGDLPARRRHDVVAAAARVDGDDHALRAEAQRRLAQQLGARQRRGVHTDLVGAGAQQPVDVVDLAHNAATDGQG